MPTYKLAAHAKLEYAWDFPASRGKKLVLDVLGARRALDILEIGDLVPFKFSVRLIVSGGYPELTVKTDWSRTQNRLTGCQSGRA